MRLVDSHAHLQGDPFDADRDEVVAAAGLAGVVRLLVPGWDADSSAMSLELAARHATIDGSAGIHPHVAAASDDAAWARVEALAADSRTVAVGETGLDYDRAFSPREVQLANLRRHLDLGLRIGKPLILHCRSQRRERDAQDELVGQLRAAGVGGAEWSARFAGRPPAILHSFSGPVDYAGAALELGLAISFSGLCFRHGEEVSADVARIVPADRLLVETDAPYLSPPGAPKRRNEPQYVATTARWLAEQRSEEPDALGERLVENYDRTFRLCP